MFVKIRFQVTYAQDVDHAIRALTANGFTVLQTSTEGTFEKDVPLYDLTGPPMPPPAPTEERDIQVVV